jgi:peptidyl-dipeptidase A
MLVCHLSSWLFSALAFVGLWMMSIDSAWAAGPSVSNNQERAKRFIRRHEATIAPLEIEVNRLWWTANVSGKDEDYRRKQEAETKLNLSLADPETFAELKAIHAWQLS